MILRVLKRVCDLLTNCSFMNAMSQGGNSTLITRLLATAFLLFSVTPAVGGQTPDSLRSDSMYFPGSHDPVVVTASREAMLPGQTGLSVISVETETLREISVTAPMADALESVPGVIVQDRHNLSLGERISVRGVGARAQFGVRGIKILVDNIPLTLPDGQAQTNTIDWFSAREVEVVRGPSASLYGNAAGGVIRVNTGPPGFRQPFRMKAQGVTGSFGHREVALSLSGTGKGFSYLAAGTHARTDGFRDHAAAQYTRFNVKGTAEVTANTSLTGVFAYYRAPYLLNPSTLSREDAEENPAMSRGYIRQQGAGERVHQAQGGITLRRRFPDSGDLETTLYGIRRVLTNPIPGRVIRLDRVASGWRSVYNRDLILFGAESSLKMGMDVEGQFDDRRESVNRGLPDEMVGSLQPEEVISSVRLGDRLIDQRESVYNIGPFGEVTLPVFTRTELMLGGRYDHYRYRVTDHLSGKKRSRVMARFSPRVGVLYRPDNMPVFYGNYSRGFQTPTTSELSNRPTQEGGFNQELDPESYHSVEIGVRGENLRQFAYQAVIYRMVFSDLLVPYQIRGTEAVYYENAGKARNMGLEAWIRWRPFPSLEWTLMYTGQQFRFRDYLTSVEIDGESHTRQLEGNAVPGVPPHQLFFNVRFQDSGYHTGLSFRWTDAYYANNYNGSPPGQDTPERRFINPPAAVLNAEAGMQTTLGSVMYELTAGVKNILDQRYNGSIVPNAFGGRYFEPAPGRHWFLRLQVQI